MYGRGHWREAKLSRRESLRLSGKCDRTVSRWCLPIPGCFSNPYFLSRGSLALVITGSVNPCHLQKCHSPSSSLESGAVILTCVRSELERKTKKRLGSKHGKTPRRFFTRLTKFMQETRACFLAFPVRLSSPLHPQKGDFEWILPPCQGGLGGIERGKKTCPSPHLSSGLPSAEVVVAAIGVRRS